MRVELALCALLGASAAHAQDRVVVASKNFTESRILGELMTLMLEEHTDLEVVHRANLGGTKVCYDALIEGQVDLYAEYTGTAWSIHLREPEPNSDPLEVFVRVRDRFAREHQIEWLPPFGFENSYAIAMSEARAAELGVRTISDLIEHQGELRAAFSVEFTSREDGYPGLSEHYGLVLADVSSLEHGLAYRAVANGQTDLIDAYTTDGKLREYPVRLLEDDLAFFPPYHAAPIVRQDLLDEHPEVGAALRKLAFVLPEREMIELNYAVEDGGREFREVARSFLATAGLVDAPEGGAERPRAEPGLLAFFAGRWRETLGLTWQHVQLTLVAVLLAVLVAVPLGVAASRSRPLERICLGAAGVIQTVPSLALLAFLVPLPLLGLSARSAVVALFLYSVLPILRNTHTGIRGVAPDLVDAARGMGLTPAQVLLRVQLPLAARTILAGIRTAAVISIGVATLAAFIGAGGLGEPIVVGLYLNDTRLILAGAVPAAALALVADFVLGRVEAHLTPRGLRSADAGP